MDRKLLPCDVLVNRLQERKFGTKPASRSSSLAVVFFPWKSKVPVKAIFGSFWVFFTDGNFFSRTLFHAHFGFFTDTFCDFFTGMIFIFTDVKVGFCYSFDGVNQKKISRTPTIFHACDFEKIFTVTFCISRALFTIFSQAFKIFTGRNVNIFTKGDLIFTGKKHC